MHIIEAPWEWDVPPFQITDNVWYVGSRQVSNHLIDTGDGLVLIDTGILLGAPDNLELFFTALFFAGIFALVSCVFFHKKRKDTFPFVPFLLIAYVGMLLWG